MGLSITFYFANGDEHYVHMSYSSYWERIFPLFTDEDFELDLSPPDGKIVEGECVVRMWEVCKQARYIDFRDTRVPIKMMQC